jgi:RHH-type proline utilization regulon transcriptional repressor/proline dehydrogenase/delta 1-pyrroline-5-carboxylate dehydrogenase
MRIDYLETPSVLQQAITAHYDVPEDESVASLLSIISVSEAQRIEIQAKAAQLVNQVRAARKSDKGIDAFMQEYDLSSEEGVALMCLAEALLRIPDAETADKLLKDKLGSADWDKHAGNSSSWFVNAATWSLMLTGNIYREDETEGKIKRGLKSLAAKGGGVFIRNAVRQGMKILGKQFVLGQTIDEALNRAQDAEKMGYLHSYDMLGEAARTEEDAQHYYLAYEQAIHAIGASTQGAGPVKGSGLSIKLSALHSRYKMAKRQDVLNKLGDRLLKLAVLAKQYNIGLTVDAEEADRLELSLEIFEKTYLSADLENYQGFGLAVQAYQKRAPYVLDFLADLARRGGRKIMVRLVKGAYWDYEIKNAQTMGYDNYPVYTRKNNTDVSYLACAKKLLGMREFIFPQFATHNAQTLSTIYVLAGDNTDYEFQCLHGMGRSLYDQIVGAENLNRICRIYAPVGRHQELLAYLVRRLLENGANTSFVNRITDENEPIEKIIQDPIQRVVKLAHKAHPHIPLPPNLYGADRKNSLGINLSDNQSLQLLKTQLSSALSQQYESKPTVLGAKCQQAPKQVFSPIDNQYFIGKRVEADVDDCDIAIANATHAFVAWDEAGVEVRAELLKKLGDALEQSMPEFMALAIVEAGKTVADAVAEVREAVDFCRYYADQALKHLMPITMPGPTGELNKLVLHGRGPFLCISPWNFPLAIFIGQIVAALVAGNTVIAKPAEHTSLIAAKAVALMYAVGFPENVIQLLPGKGSIIGNKLSADERVKGIMFTGSTEVAKSIQRNLAERDGEIIPFIAETGGQNIMIVDSSALPEQVVADVIDSAFGSAGQRCSALRILFLQEEVADKIIHMLIGAMKELTIGDPRDMATDIGPVIAAGAQAGLQEHIDKMKVEAKLLYQVGSSDVTAKGTFIGPVAFELNSLEQLKREQFGPVLHILRYKESEFDATIDAINSTGYGLTFGAHSRITHVIEKLCKKVRVGNVYINRNMIGAVVGVQPFGGEGLSGTGPKAGGPHYLPRLCAEKTISINTTAAGGNATLLSLPEDE